MSGEPPYALDDADLLAACEEEAYGARGPGGQHVQRHAAAVRLRHRDTAVVASCQDHRDRQRNRALALRRLRLRLLLRLPGQSRRAWLDERRRGQRLPVGANAGGYHLVVAVLLDALHDNDWRPGPAAAALGLGSRQLTRVLAADKEVWQHVNSQRQAQGYGSLRQ